VDRTGEGCSVKDHFEEYEDTDTGAWLPYALVFFVLVFVGLILWSAYHAVFGA
jgi:hypothetical protein